ncbi:MAG: pitrilysin family protein [Verrucomicrobiota bacterium]
MNCQKTSLPSASLNIDLPASDYQHFQLDNGLTLIVEEDHRSPVVSVQAWCRAGSITEGPYLGSGISHILEHMLFKGTERRGNSEIATTIQSIGGYTNAYTSFDRTVYFIDAPSAGWRTALDVLADAIFHSTLPEDEYIKEMEVVRREFAMGFDDPNRVLQKLLFDTAFCEHPYQYPVIGYLENFNRLTRADVQDYYQRYYVPNNLTFIVTGAVHAEEVRDALSKMTASVERQMIPDIYIPDEPRQLGLREQHIEFPTDATRLYLAFHIPGITHQDLYALDVLAILAGQGRSSRLHQSLVEEKQKLRNVGAFSYTPAQSGLWAVAGTMHPDSSFTRDEIVSAILDELQQFQQRIPDQQELDKAKRMVISDHVDSMVTVSGKAASIGNSWFIARDLDFGSNYLQGITDVSPADVRRVARDYLQKNNMTVVSINPAGKAQAAETGQAEVARTAQASLSSFSGGLPLVEISDPSLPLVTVSVSMKGGLLTEPADRNGISYLTAQLMKKGTLNLSAAEIADQIESLGGSLTVQSGNNSITASVSVLESDLETAISLLADVVLRPAFSSEELEKERRKQLSDLKLELDQPMRVARNQLRETLFQSHPYSRNVLGDPAAIENLTQDDIMDFHRARIAKNSLVFSIAGHYDTEQATSLFARYFPASEFDQPATGPEKHAAAFGGTGQTLELNNDKVQAIVQIGFPGISIHSEDRVALDLIDQALSDLASRLFLRIRERQSLAYFVGAAQLTGVDPGYFMFYAGTRPETSLRVRDEILDEIRLLVQDGLEPSEFKRAKAKLNGKRLLQNQSSAQQAAIASLNVLYGLGIDYESRYQAELAALTLEDANRVAQKIFGQENYVCVIVQPDQDTSE